MTRDNIKFKRYHFDSNGTLIHKSFWGFMDGGFANYSSISGEDKSKAIDCLYTGINDNGNTELYEGDIIGILPRYLVAFKDGMFVCTKNIEGDVMDDYKVKWVVRENNAKVIGNIYQNPELLNA